MENQMEKKMEHEMETGAQGSACPCHDNIGGI